MTDMYKVDLGYYNSEYLNLSKYIMDTQSPKESVAYKTVLQLSHGEQRPLRRVQSELDSYLEAKEMREELTPWFQMWKKWFLDKIRFQDHELVEQPVGFIYFIMVDEPDPNRAIDNMRREMPSQYKQGLYMDGSPQTG